MFSTNQTSNTAEALDPRKELNNDINAQHANIVLTRKYDSVLPSGTRDVLDKLNATKAATAAKLAVKAQANAEANAEANAAKTGERELKGNGGNKRKSKKTNIRKKKRGHITRRHVKRIKHKKK